MSNLRAGNTLDPSCHCCDPLRSRSLSLSLSLSSHYMLFMRFAFMSTFFAVPFFKYVSTVALDSSVNTGLGVVFQAVSVRCTITYLLLNVFSFLVNAFGFILGFLYLVAKAVVVNGVLFAGFYQ